VELLHRSQHLHVIQRSKDYAVYHKLFGNLSLLDGAALSLLERFSAPMAAQEVARGEEELELVQEFRERFFLVPAGEDERSFVEDDKAFRSENLESGYLLKGIQLILSNDCNLGCSYCFQETLKPADGQLASSSASPRRIQLPLVSADTGKKASTGHCGSSATPSAEAGASEPAVKRMSTNTAAATLRSAVEAVQRAGNRQLSVEFFGGEPLVNWPTIESVLDEFGNGLEYDWGTGLPPVQLFYSMTTNATLVTDEIARKLREHSVTVTVSFDSPRNVERTTKRGTSADAIILEGLDVLARHGSILTFNTVISVANVDSLDVEGLFEVARRCKVRAIGLILDLDAKPYEDREAMSRVVEALMAVCERAKVYGIPITGYWHQIYEQIVGEQLINLQKGYKTCAAEGCKLSFEPNGNVTHCKTTEKTIGTLDKLQDVFKSHWYRAAALKAYETTPYCRGCMVEGFCSGLCMGTLQKTYSDINAIVPPACEVYRKVTEQLILAMPDEKAPQLTLSSAS